MNAEERLEVGRKIFDELILDPHIYGNREYVASQIASILIPYEAQARKEARQEDIDALDERWNCNCLTDESLERTECECAKNPAHTLRKLGQFNPNSD